MKTFKIPREVWRFCVDQIRLYPLNEAHFKSLQREIDELFLESGMSGPPDPTGVHVHSGQGPQEGKYLLKEKAISNPNYRYLSKSVCIMEMAATNEHSEVLNAIWTQGWRDNEMIAVKAKTSTRQVARVKHELIRRIAAGWGLW